MQSFSDLVPRSSRTQGQAFLAFLLLLILLSIINLLFLVLSPKEDVLTPAYDSNEMIKRDSKQIQISLNNNSRDIREQMDEDKLERAQEERQKVNATLRFMDFDTFKKHLEQFPWNFDTNTKIDWHDAKQYKQDLWRQGLGEQGGPVTLPALHMKKIYSQLQGQYGFNAMVSDMIAITRSVRDVRFKECKLKHYSADLPTASVIIPFHNELMTALLRTITSVANRSNRTLLQEIILVDDFSDKEHLKEPLEIYIKESQDLRDLVRIIRLPERKGLVGARQTGAKAARSQVLVFLDCHTEANYNWLPPLLEPIAKDYRTAVCPFIDIIDHMNFRYRKQDDGARGAFNWRMQYKRLPLLPDDLKDPTEPFKSPVMAGGLFAISAKYFWELGGYDEGLVIWGGEQYEISFKIWTCGGQIVDAPCSRFGHIYKTGIKFSPGGKGNYLARNIKRVAEIWMDDYKDYVYKRLPYYRKIDAGDISEQLELRRRLRCKPFKWFMEEVAFDLVDHYPLVEPEDYAKGALANVAHPDFCVSYQGGLDSAKFEMVKCNNDSQKSEFTLTWKDLRTEGNCMDVSNAGDRAPVMIAKCHGGKGNQFWKYDWDARTLHHGDGTRCLDMDSDTLELFVSSCKSSLRTQQWKFDTVNESMLRKRNETKS